jgi:CO/xanthine dehydrogenase Mo-binding subunit/aerobic-type carbon monoxide dehydrogenase small subunit (CoxS/CutS family)
MEQLNLTVNGQKVSLPALPGETLAALLRHRLHLTGTKIGCEESECGSCTVIVDGEPILSCMYPAARACGKEVTTIEGLSAPQRNSQASVGIESLHLLQQAFVEHGAVQCGFCIPGQIMTAYALLLRNPDPTSEEVRLALKDTLCRCAGYPAIESAILAAAESLRTGAPLRLPHIADSIHQHAVVGHTHVRPDAIEKVNGRALFTDDLSFPGMLFAKVRRAMVPHAILKRLEISRAVALPGVAAVLTADDIPGEHNHGLVVYDWPVMVGLGERVRYVGDALALVAAENQEIAEQASSLIEAELELQPVVSDPVQARQADVPQLHPQGNLLKHIKVRKGDIEKGMNESDVVIEHTFHTPIMEHAFLEPECSIAVPTPDERMEIYVGSQIPYQDRTQVARVLGWQEERIRIVGQLMGGGFGGKEDVAGQIHAALLARSTGRPVKLLFSRHESMLVHPKRHATQIRVKMGATRDGRLKAIETELYGDTGAYASLGDKVMTRATTHSAGPYEVPHVRADCYAMYTNNPPAGAFRGFGVTQSAFAIESMMDMLAETLKVDRVELRRLNSLRVGSLTNTGQLLRDSVGLQECIDRVTTEMAKVALAKCGLGREALFSAHAASGMPHVVHAWGFAAGYKNTGLGGGALDKSGAEVELYEDGSLEVRSSSAEMGQGLVAVMQMVVAEELSTTPARVRVLVMDTDLTPDGGPTTASRQTYVTGNASRLAARALRQAIAVILAEKYDVPPHQIRFGNGCVHANGQTLTFADVAREMKSMGQLPLARYEYVAPQTRPLGSGGNMHFAFSFAAQAAEVEVDRRTGEVRVLQVIAANDVGAAVNPVGLQGQVEGGVMMGIGTCLTEEFIVENGYVVTDHLARYRMPGIMLTPEITSIIVEHPTAEGPYGAKGVGEICTIPTPPAITNAIYNAVGVRVDRLPVDQELIARTLWGRKDAPK